MASTDPGSILRRLDATGRSADAALRTLDVALEPLAGAGPVDRADARAYLGYALQLERGHRAGSDAVTERDLRRRVITFAILVNALDLVWRERIDARRHDGTKPA